LGGNPELLSGNVRAERISGHLGATQKSLEQELAPQHGVGARERSSGACCSDLEEKEESKEEIKKKKEAREVLRRVLYDWKWERVRNWYAVKQIA
jgi:hypothetical protein